MLQSLIVYGFLGFTLSFMGNIAAKRERINLNKNYNTPFFTGEIIFSLLFFAFISGVRWNVGVDHSGYLEIYNEISRGWELKKDFESLFLLITKIFAKLSIHFSFYFGFLALIQLFFVYYAFKKERYILPFLGVLIIFSDQYLLWVNGIRQGIAACIFVFSIHFITDKKLIKYLLCIGLATLFHKSALILVIFYIIPIRNYFRNPAITSILLIVAILLGISPHWLSATTQLENIVSLIGYDSYAERLDYFISENAREMAFGPRRLFSTLLYIMIIWVFQDFHKINNNKRVLQFFNLSILGAFHHNLFANTGTLFLRPTYYLTIFTPIVVSYLLVFLYKKNRISFKFILLFLLAISHLIIAIISDFGKGTLDFTNYKFFWDYTSSIY